MTTQRILWLDSATAVREEIGRASAAKFEGPQADVFCTLEWFENLASNGLEPDPNVRCRWLVASDAHGGVCLPLLAGRTLNGLSNYYSSLYSPVTWSNRAAGEPAPNPWPAVCKYLRQHAARWPVITVSPLDAQSPFYREIMAALSLAGYRSDSFFAFGNWYLEVAHRPFSTYFSSLPSALRHSVERGQRRLSRQGEWHIDIEQGGTGLESAIANFVQVYSQSWKGPEPNARFIPALARVAATQGWLRLGVLRLDGRAIAAQMWLVKGRKASIYKLAYVQGFERFSAGSVLTHALMRHAFDVDQVQEVDYLTGDDAYKRDWMSHRRERRGIVAFNPATLSGNWAAVKHFGGQWLRRFSSRETGNPGHP